MAPRQATLAAAQKRKFVAQIEQLLADGQEIFQLPPVGILVTPCLQRVAECGRQAGRVLERPGHLEHLVPCRLRLLDVPEHPEGGGPAAQQANRRRDDCQAANQQTLRLEVEVGQSRVGGFEHRAGNFPDAAW